MDNIFHRYNDKWNCAAPAAADLRARERVFQSVVFVTNPMEGGGMTNNANYVIPMNMLESFYDEPGERGWILEGSKHGLTTTSAIVTETAPGGGPPLHVHHTEEIHVLPECQMGYVMGETEFDVVGPCVVRIPAELPHTFLNRGSSPVRLVCFFPANNFWTNYEEVGPNPLVVSAAPQKSNPGR